MESNDSPEIPDGGGGETSDIPGLPSGVEAKPPNLTHIIRQQERQHKKNFHPDDLNGAKQNPVTTEEEDYAHTPRNTDTHTHAAKRKTPPVKRLAG